MQYKLLCLVIVGLSSSTGYGQTEEHILNVIDRMFEGMRTSDSSMVRSAFAAEVSLATVTVGKDGKTVLQKESSLDGFLNAIAAEHPPYEEPVWDCEVQVDGAFAQVWCKYAFYVAKKFSHCGVDAFHLYREADGWKIFYVCDTRRRTDCEVPEEIQKKFE